MNKKFNFYLLILYLFSFSSTSAMQQSHFKTQSAIYVIGDIHGAYNEILSTLKIAKLIDEQNNWSGGSAHFVSLGDILDRGPATKKVVDLFMKLQLQAEQAGGKFHVLLGNHEIMNLKGDLRYLSAGEIDEFAEQETYQQRSKAYQQFIKFHQLPDNKQVRKKFKQKYPAGYFSHLEDFSLMGKYGRWLLSLPFVIKINDQLFAHAGLSKQIEDNSVESLNLRLKSELLAYLESWNYFLDNNKLSFDISFKEREEYLKKEPESKQKSAFIISQSSQAFSKQGPAWYRGNAICHPYFEQDILEEKLQYWDSKKLWVGHTTTARNDLQHRLSDKLQMMDTGMLNSHYRGQPWIGKIETNKLSFINGITGELGKSIEAAKRQYNNPYNMSHQQIENFLQTANITNKETTKEGRTKPFKVKLEKDGKILHGIFKYKDSHHLANKGRWSKDKNDADRYQYELAAYHLDKILDIGLVPVTVERTIDNKKGILQLWLEGLTSQLRMLKKGEDYDGFCDYDEQINMIDSFDYLILNTDRNQSNIMLNADDLQIWFIDHSKSFGTATRRPKMLKGRNIKATKSFKNALRKLTAERLKKLRPWLHKKQIQAILKRSEKMLRDSF